MSPLSFDAQRTLAFDDHFFVDHLREVEKRANSMILFNVHIDVPLVFFL